MGPTLPISREIHAMKYRAEGEDFKEAMSRVAGALKDSDEHFEAFREILLDMRFLPAGRVQAAMGSPRETTPYNCFVSATLEDSMDGIMEAATRAATTMRLGGGIGYDFSTLRPRGDRIKSLDSSSSGPVSFMDIFDAVCGTISSAGHRRGAQMGMLRVDHPDIEEFIHAKRNSDKLPNFNISVAVTDGFMRALEQDGNFDLTFNGEVYKTVKASYLWEAIMRNNWDWAEPGVIFIDRINAMNNLWYCEQIAATNPCAEQPLPPNGACLLGSFNFVKYLQNVGNYYRFNLKQFMNDIPVVVRAMDNIVDRAVYPMREQREEALSKRRMGLGVCGVANAIEVMGMPYGSDRFVDYMEHLLKTLRDFAYMASADLAAEKGAFPLYDEEGFLNSGFVNTLPDTIKKYIRKCNGIRNSHLLSIAPTGTISLAADNISSGIEPVFSHSYDRTIRTTDGEKVETITDYGYRELGVKGKTASECTASEHLAVLLAASAYVDSAVSKTCNIGEEVTWDEFKEIYRSAWKGGARGCTTFRPAGKRYGVLRAVREPDNDSDRSEADSEGGTACYIDAHTGIRTCE